MGDGSSIWKKEIRLRKRYEPSTRPQGPAAPEANPSIWKRELRFGGKKPAAEAAASEPAQPLVEQRSLWDPQPPDSQLAPQEGGSAAEQAPAPVELDPAMGAPSLTPWGGTGSEAQLEGPGEDGATASAFHGRASSGASEAEEPPEALRRKHADEPAWAAGTEVAPLDPDQAEPGSEGEGPYGWAASDDERWEVVVSIPPTARRPEPDRVDPDAASESRLPASVAPDETLAAEPTFSLTPESFEPPGADPSGAWWGRVEPEPGMLGTRDTDARPSGDEPDPVRPSAGPAPWSRPAWPEWRSEETEQPAANGVPELAVQSPASAEQAESPVPVDAPQEEPELDSGSLAQEAEALTERAPWSRPAWPEWRLAQTELPAVLPEPEIVVPPLAPAEPADASAEPTGWAPPLAPGWRSEQTGPSAASWGAEGDVPRPAPAEQVVSAPPVDSVGEQSEPAPDASTEVAEQASWSRPGWPEWHPEVTDPPAAGSEPEPAVLSPGSPDQAGSAKAPTEPAPWSQPAWPEWHAAEAEPPTAVSGSEPGLPLPASAEPAESPVPLDPTDEEPVPEASAGGSTAEGEVEWPMGDQAEPAELLPMSGWEQAAPAPEDLPPGETELLLPEAGPVAETKVSGRQEPKPSLLKRELRMPGTRRRAAKQSSLKASDAHPIKNIVGLRVGSSQLAAAYVHNNGGAELVQIARTPLARGIVTGGEVRDPEGLTVALKKFFAEHKLPRRGIRLGIASNRIGVRVLEVPALDDPRLFENSIRFHAQETLPISVSDAIIDHVVLGAGAGLEPMVRILLVFAHRELVDRHVQACRRAGLKLEGIDFEAFALLRALGAPRPAEVEATRAVVAVAIGQERTIFAVSDGRVCDFTRVLEWGGGSLDVAIARALNLAPSQAEPLKLALSLDGDQAPSQLTPEEAEAARAAIRTELQSLSRELVSSLQFYQARPGSLDIGEIMLSGGGAQLDGLAAELERHVGVPVVTGDPFARVEVGRKVDRTTEAGSLAVAIGLGIED